MPEPGDDFSIAKLKTIIPVVSDQRFYPSVLTKLDPNAKVNFIGVRCPLCTLSAIGVYNKDGTTKDECGQCGFPLEDIVWKPLVRVLFEQTRLEKIVFWFKVCVSRILKFFLVRRKKTVDDNGK